MNVNTGWKGGAMQWIEKKIEKNVWLVCMLQTNELPLRHLIINLDGPTLHCLTTSFLGKLA